MNADRYYLADQEVKLDTPAERQRLTHRLRQYLELRNVGILLGNGCSIPLGSPTLNNVKAMRQELQAEPYRLKDDNSQTQALRLLDLSLPSDTPPVTVEAFLGIINNLITNAQMLPTATTALINGQPVTEEQAQALDTLLKKWLYHRCREISDPEPNKLHHHRELLRRILLRSTHLPRCTIFTTNYDLIIEHALDSLGVVYLDGFTGS